MCLLVFFSASEVVVVHDTREIPPHQPASDLQSHTSQLRRVSCCLVVLRRRLDGGGLNPTGNIGRCGCLVSIEDSRYTPSTHTHCSPDLLKSKSNAFAADSTENATARAFVEAILRQQSSSLESPVASATD